MNLDAMMQPLLLVDPIPTCNYTNSLCVDIFHGLYSLFTIKFVLTLLFSKLVITCTYLLIHFVLTQGRIESWNFIIN